MVGPPLLQGEILTHITSDLLEVIPLLVIIIGALILAILRSFVAVISILGSGLLALVTTAGLIGLLGLKVYLATILIPILILTVGLCDQIHLYTAFIQARKCGASPDEAVKAALTGMQSPLVITTITTVIALLTFLVSESPALQSVGLSGALGLLIALGYSLYFAPACWKFIHASHKDTWHFPSSWFANIHRLYGKYTRTGTAATLSLTLIAGFCATKLSVNDSWLNNISPESTVVTAATLVDTRFSGVHRLYIQLEAESPEFWMSSENKARLKYLKQEISLLHRVGKVLDYTDLESMVENKDIAVFVTDPAQINILNTPTGDKLARSLITRNGAQVLVHVFLQSADAKMTRVLERRVLQIIDDWPESVKVTFAGDAAVSLALVDSIVEMQSTQIGIAGVLIFLIAWIYFHCWRTAFITLVPLASSLLIGLGLMSVFGISLGVATSMIAIVTLGVGTDFAVITLVRYRQLQEKGVANAAKEAIDSVLPGISICTVVMTIGMTCLLASSSPALTAVGLVIAINLLWSALISITLVWRAMEHLSGKTGSD